MTRDWLIRRVGRIKAVRSYHLTNGFRGTACSPIADYPLPDHPGSWGWLMRDLERFRPKVRRETETKVCVRFHSNHWLEIDLEG